MSRDPLSDLYPPPVPGETPVLAAVEVRIPGRGLSVTGLVFASLGLLTGVAGMIGMFFGVAAQRKGDPLARWAIVLSAMSIPGFIAMLLIMDAAGLNG